jgi:hypothetical protein
MYFYLFGHFKCELPEGICDAAFLRVFKNHLNSNFQSNQINNSEIDFQSNQNREN